MQERLIRLLETIAGAASPPNATELARLTGLPRATIYRNITSLVDCGFVEVSDCGSRYILGMRFVRIALTGKSDTHVINAVTANLQNLVKDLGETAFLARFRGGRVDLVHIEIPRNVPPPRERGEEGHEPDDDEDHDEHEDDGVIRIDL